MLKIVSSNLCFNISNISATFYHMNKSYIPKMTSYFANLYQCDSFNLNCGIDDNLAIIKQI